MAIGKLGQRRQVVIPKEICEEVGLYEGDFLEVEFYKGNIVIKPKKLVDSDDIITPEEEKIVLKGEKQLLQGKAKTWKQIKDEMGS